MLNEFEVILVVDDLEKHGIKNYEILEGNQCIWVRHDRLNCYYIFKDGKINDVQYD